MIKLDALVNIVGRLYDDPIQIPRPLHLASPLHAALAGRLRPGDAARAGRTTASRMAALVGAPDPVDALLGPFAPLTIDDDDRARSTIGTLLIGQVAERVFEQLWPTIFPDPEIALFDDRARRGDTDFLVAGRGGHRMFRINIKFFGSLFRQAREAVGLDPADCFPLATYKIHSATKKQEEEAVPYVFVVVGVPNMTGSTIGEQLPDEVIQFVVATRKSSKMSRKRDVEDRIVAALVTDPGAFGVRSLVETATGAIAGAPWRFISARRADALLRDKLFERAFALRIPRFTSAYRRAEIDMHFSLHEDMKDLAEMGEIYARRGITQLASMLERGAL